MGNPPPSGYRTTSIVLPPELAAYVDEQAKRFALSKAGYLRQLIARDREAQGRSAAA